MRGQSAFEFTILMALGMLLMMSIIIIGSEYSKDAIAEQRHQALLDLGYTLQDEFILATTVQEGYTRTITLPDSVNSFNYDVTNSATAIQLSSGNQRFSFKIPDTTGTLVKGTNTLTYDGSLEVTQ